MMLREVFVPSRLLLRLVSFSECPNRRGLPGWEVETKKDE